MSATPPLDALMLVAAARLDDGRTVRVRPVAGADAAALQGFVRRLSAASRYRRFLCALGELAPAALRRLVEVDHRRSLTLVAVADQAIVAVAQYAQAAAVEVAEVAVVVADDFQHVGLGRRLLGALVGHASRAGFERLVGDALADNAAVLALVRRFGFHTWPNREERGLVRIARELGGPWSVSREAFAALLARP